MATSLQADSFAAINIKERAALDADVAVGAGSLTLKSNQGIQSGDFLYVGALSREGCEKVIVASLSWSYWRGAYWHAGIRSQAV